MRPSSLALAIVAAAALPVAVAAQNAGAPGPKASLSPNTETHGSPTPENASDFVVSGHVHIDSLTVQSSGTSQFNLTVKPGQSGWTVRRSNVPAKLQNGKTYKNVEYHFTASGRFAQPSASPAGAARPAARGQTPRPLPSASPGRRFPL